MSEPTVSKKIDKLPPEAKKQAQDFVDFLYQRYVQTKSGTKESGASNISDSFFWYLERPPRDERQCGMGKEHS